MKKRILSILLVLTITASLSMATAPLALAQTPSVVLSHTEFIMNIDTARQLTATMRGNVAGDHIVFRSLNEAVATVTHDGIVHAVGGGVTQVRAEMIRGGAVIASADCRVEVRIPAVPVGSISLNETNITMTMTMPVNPVLTATIHPANANAYLGLTWTSSNINVAFLSTEPGLNQNLQRRIIPVAPGTTTITVRAANGRTVTAMVTVESFRPVTNVIPASTQLGSGTTINLNQDVTVAPANSSWHGLPAALRVVEWRRVVPEGTTVVGATISGSTLTIPWNQTGTIVVEAVVHRGEGTAAAPWHQQDVDFVRNVTFNVVPFVSVSEITNVPGRMVVGRPLTLSGTIIPATALRREIIWSFTPDSDNEAGAFFNHNNTILTAQRPGTVSVRATVRNGGAALSGLGGESVIDFEQDFIIWATPYEPNQLTLRAEPGGSVSGAGTGRFAEEEVVTITATPDRDFIFAGWHSTNGGRFANSDSATTAFTMPRGDTTVTAFFTFVGFSDAGGTATPWQAPEQNRWQQTPAQTVRRQESAQIGAQTFTDVNAGDWFSAGAGFVHERGWMGAAAGTTASFRPAATITLGEVAFALHRMAGNPTVLNSAGEVLRGQSAAIEWLRAAGILTGAHGNAEARLTRQEIAVIVGGLAGYMRWSYNIVRSPANFTDMAQVSQVARGHINDLFRARIINGRTETTFAPHDVMSRAEFAALLLNFADSMGI